MKGLVSLVDRLRRALGAGAFERQMDEEIRHHLEMETAANVERGLPPAEAAAEARRTFGSVAFVKDECRDAWASRAVDAVRQDVRLAWRTARRSPLFTGVAALTLALGIGANSAIFTVVHAVLLERLPYPNADRVVTIWEESVRRPGKLNVVAPSNFLQWRERAGAFTSLSAFYDWTPSLVVGGEADEVAAQSVTPDYFDTLGVAPVRGRTFTAADAGDGTASVALISEGLWARRFGRDPGVVGRVIQIEARPVSVIGILPDTARLLVKRNSFTGHAPDVWMPLTFTAADAQPRGRYLSAIGRLKDGESLDAARSQMNAIAAALERQWPAFDAGWRVRLTPLHDELAGDLRPALTALSGAVALVLLIACANVANLLLSRGAARQREFAIRAALGAGRGRVLRQLLAEALVLAALGGAGGLLLAEGMLRLLLALGPVELSPGASDVHVDRIVIAFTAATSLLTAIACGLAPAFDRGRGGLSAAFSAGPRHTAGPDASRLRRLFVVTEVALGFVLVAGAGLMLRSFTVLRGVDPGFRPARVLTARISLPSARYADRSARFRFFSDLVDRASRLPGVESAGMVSFLPLAELGSATDFQVEGAPAPRPGQMPVVDVRVCDNGYLQSLGIPLVSGRLFNGRELRERSDVVLINETMAREYFPDGSAIGHRVTINMGPVGGPSGPSTVVGVVGNVKQSDLVTAARATAYWPYPQLPTSGMRLTLRASGDPLALGPALARIVRDLDPDQPVGDLRTMDQWVARSMAQTRFVTGLLGGFAALALALAAIGIYGVMAYSMTQRTAEIGVRLALGAAATQVVSMVIRQGLGLIAAGTAIGLPLALVLARTSRSLLVGTSSADPLAFAGAAAVLAVVGLAASGVPALRAARIDPATALRDA